MNIDDLKFGCGTPVKGYSGPLYWIFHPSNMVTHYPDGRPITFLVVTNWKLTQFSNGQYTVENLDAFDFRRLENCSTINPNDLPKTS